MNPADHSPNGIPGSPWEIESQLRRDASAVAGVLELLRIPLVPVRRTRSKKKALHLSFLLDTHAAQLRALAADPTSPQEGARALLSGIALAEAVMARDGYGPRAPWSARARRNMGVALVLARHAATRRPHLSPAVPARLLGDKLELLSQRWSGLAPMPQPGPISSRARAAMRPRRRRRQAKQHGLAPAPGQ